MALALELWKRWSEQPSQYPLSFIITYDIKNVF